MGGGGRGAGIEAYFHAAPLIRCLAGGLDVAVGRLDERLLL